MITVQQAKQLIAEATPTYFPITVSLLDALGYVVAKDIIAPLDIPAFAQSSMDGYAITFEEHQHTLQITTVIQAGQTEMSAIASGQAARIFTGAPLPVGADTVIMQEKVTVTDSNLLSCHDDQLTQGSNVRPIGSEIQKGMTALQAGEVLTPAAIGFLAGIGITTVEVFPKPSVALILTGNELQKPGNALSFGQVYESNSYTIRTALQQLGINSVTTYEAKDAIEELSEVLSHAIEKHSLVLLTGGVSVGDYDFVLAAAARNDVQTIFHRIAQKPGKPLFFGKKVNTLVFGLPGNPASVLTCFYQYVLPCIQQLQHKNDQLPVLSVPLKKRVTKVAGLTQFLKAHYDGQTVTPLSAQESFRMRTFAVANCFICLEGDRLHYEADDLVPIHLLPTTL